MDQEKIGVFISTLRKEQGMTQQQLADAIGVSNKTISKTCMRKLLLKGGDLQVLQFNTEDMKKVEKMAKKYGILYSILPDCNRKDGLSEESFIQRQFPV